MKDYAPGAIRNVAFAGHSGSGKTTLQEACLHLAGASDRLGRVEDGNTVSDYLPEEIKRKSSIWATLLAFEQAGTKFNFLDCPGYADYFGELVAAVAACENVVLVANATTGVELGFEIAARRAARDGLARFVFINQLDRERGDFDRVFNDLRDRLHLPAIALTYPLGAEAGLRGYIDVIEGIAYDETAGSAVAVPMPEASRARVEELRLQLVECAVECDDLLMEKYLDGEPLGNDELGDLVARAVAARCVVPVLCGSAPRRIGVAGLAPLLSRFAASPATAPPRPATDAQGREIAIPARTDAPFSGYVFKTFSDPFTGRHSYIKIAAGRLAHDAEITNVSRGGHERLAHLFAPLGKKQIEIGAAQAGDIVVVSKLKATTTGDSLSAQADGPRFARPELPESLFTLCVEPATHGDDDKLNDALARLTEEDQTFKVTRSAETGQLLISGLGDIHLNTIVARLKGSFGVEVKLLEPRVPYRETIRKKVKQEGKLKKQSGGHGQFADVWLEIEPAKTGTGLLFVDKVVGGVVPRAFIPAVEEGAREALKEGPLAGYPLVDVRVTLWDGKYHDVDSSYQAFKVAGAMALREGAREAGPVLLEPVMETVIRVPEASAGDVVSDLNGRRGQILGMEPDGEGTVGVKAFVPEAELLQYTLALRSLTHGRGSFSKKFDHYNPVPEALARALSEAHHARREHHP